MARTTANSSNNEQPQSSVEVTLHPRSIRRSIDKLRLKQEEMRLLERKRYSSADHPAYVQRHCYRWANWWQRQYAYLQRKNPSGAMARHMAKCTALCRCRVSTHTSLMGSSLIGVFNLVTFYRSHCYSGSLLQLAVELSFPSAACPPSTL